MSDTPEGAAAVRTLRRLGYVYLGGREWQPLSARAPDFAQDLLERARKADGWAAIGAADFRAAIALVDAEMATIEDEAEGPSLILTEKGRGK